MAVEGDIEGTTLPLTDVVGAVVGLAEAVLETVEVEVLAVVVVAKDLPILALQVGTAACRMTSEAGPERLGGGNVGTAVVVR